MRRSVTLFFLILVLSAGALVLLSGDRFDPLRWWRQRVSGKAEKVVRPGRVREVRFRGEVPHRSNPTVPAWANEPGQQRELQQVFAIGGKSGREHFSFIRPSDVDIDAAGNVYVVDRVHRRLQIFAPDGSFLRSLRYDKRNVPYFLSPRKVAVSDAGEIYVWDEDKGIVCFDRNGRLVRRFRPPYRVTDLVVDSKGRLILLAPDEPLLLHKVTPTGVELLAFGEHAEEDTTLWAVFDLGHLAIGPADTLYYSTIYPYRITVYEPGGRPLLSFDRNLGILITPPTIHRDASGKVVSVTRQEISFGLAVGSDGLVYNLVRTRASRGADRIDVFSSQGEYLQIFYLPIAAVAFSMRGMRMVLLQAPPDQRVVCYDVTALTLESRTLLGREDGRGRGAATPRAWMLAP